MKTLNTKLPTYFKPLFWGYKFESINLNTNKKLVIVNTLNYGGLKEWRWLVRAYGREDLRKAIIDIPESEFRKHVVTLIKLLFNIKEFKYVSRSAKIKAERNIR